MTIRDLITAVALCVSAAGVAMAADTSAAETKPAAKQATKSVAKPAAKSSPAKKALVQKALKLQQAGIESMAQALVENPAGGMLQQGLQFASQLPAEKRDTAVKNLQADFQKYVQENVPTWKKKIVELAPSTFGATLEERFDEKELQQLVAWLESPVAQKYQQVSPDIQRALADALLKEMGPALQPKLLELHKAMGEHLGVSSQAAASAASAPARAASK
jgi:hypothetical protein